MSSRTESDAHASLRGTVLVATPYIQAVPYRRAVVLVIDHGQRGAIGLVLDNQLHAGLTQLADHARSHSSPDTSPPDTNSPDSSPPPVRLVAGALEWGPNQLERELEQGVWMTVSARRGAALISDDLWAGLVRQIGRSVLTDALRIKGFPSNPSWN